MDDDKKRGELIIRDVVRQQITSRMDRMFEEEICGAMTSNIDAPAPAVLDEPTLLADCERMIRENRRNQLTIIVDMALRWDAPLHMEETPSDGQRIEMSHRQAQEIHQHCPLKLHKVLSSERAEFVPVSGIFPEFVPMILPAPPYDMPFDTSSPDSTKGE